MSMRHLGVWPEGRPYTLENLPATLWDNLDNSAKRWPEKPALVFYDGILTYGRLAAEVAAMAGYLESVCGVGRGDRVIIQLQSTPQFVIAAYAIWRLAAVVVPVNPMNRTLELRHVVADSDARIVITAQDLVDVVRPLADEGVVGPVIVATYADYIAPDTTLDVPSFIKEAAVALTGKGEVAWKDALAAGLVPSAFTGQPDDLAALPYTSGSTGAPKGCMHTNATTMHSIFSVADWFGFTHDDVVLGVAPFFHVTGLEAAMNAPIQRGCTNVLLPRWNRDAAADLIQRYKITTWPAIPTMAVDLLAKPGIENYDLTSIRLMFGGGVAMPESVAAKLKAICGITFLEGYGMTETMAPTTANPPQAPITQCGGVPVFGTEIRAVDPQTFEEVPPAEVGEILISGPQLLKGYWKRPDADADTFVELDGKRFLRSGDLGRVDEQGYLFLVDRLKRMVNVAGYKVWPAEVEGMLFAHPAIQEVCVVGAKDERSGQVVKALVVLKDSEKGKITEAEIVTWARGVMSAYKVPRVVEFLDTLPRSGTGKVQWLALQQRENRGA